jgi:hypothetical protein
MTYKRQRVVADTYVDLKARGSSQHQHGIFESILTAGGLAAASPINVTVGLGKVIMVVNAGVDTAGSATITGTSVDRDSQAETGADTDVLTVSGTTTDTSAADANGNTVHGFSNAYISSKWFKGAITITTADLDLSDVDIYVVAFEQANDYPSYEIDTFDMSVFCNHTNGWLDAYLYALEVSGDTCTIAKTSEQHITTAVSTANVSYRLRDGNIGKALLGASDGFWIEVHPGPLASAYWEDMNTKVWLLLK